MAKKERLKVRQQAAAERTNNFDEVPFGYDDSEAADEASRCLQCKNPTCIEGCPVNINIKEFIRQLSAGDKAGAIKTIKQSNSLPAVCGRVCPQETQCEAKCVLLKTGQPINIGALERYAADWEAANLKTEAPKIKPVTGADGKQIKVAIAGSGPAGLTVAGELERGSTWLPPLARAEKAETISSREREDEPRPRVKSLARGLVIPSNLAYFLTVPMPTLLRSLTVTTFFEYVMAFKSIIGPLNFPEKFSGFQSVPS